jgi:sulfoxide reductase catalytic subunit YedY
MLIKRPMDIPSSEITPETLYHNRRTFLKMAAAAAILPGCMSEAAPEPVQAKPGRFNTDEKQTPYEDITTYNNYYEFGLAKEDPVRNAGNFVTKPWTVKVEGMVKTPKTWALEDLIKGFTNEDRVYRMRCVEGWSMVIPWLGFPLADLVKRLEPLPSAKFVEFQTLNDRKQMPGLRLNVLDWPYTEGLRMDEAMNPLTIMAVGIYGKPLPNQNGAPMRLVVPWKYGFKGAKSIATIRFVDQQPRTAWNVANPTEYGFYSNVNPEVHHPRWRQDTETRIGEFFRRKTLMFNGYTEHVAQLYAGMDLRKFY